QESKPFPAVAANNLLALNKRDWRHTCAMSAEINMLDNNEFIHWCQKLNLSEAARNVVEQVRTSDPARRVQSRSRNVSGNYPSKKMGVTIQFESHRVELATVYELEHDPDVIEYYDQPPSFKLDYQGGNGRRIVVFHTPDYFAIRGGTAGWEECKTEEQL